MDRFTRHLRARRIVNDTLTSHARHGNPAALRDLHKRDPHHASAIAHNLVMADLDTLEPAGQHPVRTPEGASDEPRIIREAETFLSSFIRSDLTYRDSVTIGGSLEPNEYVTVATFGAADELLPNDVPEPWPVRIHVHDADDEAGAYLSIDEADQLCRPIRAAIRRAKTYPQPDNNDHPSG